MKPRKKQIKWKLTIHVKPMNLSCAIDRTDSRPVPVGTYICKQKVISTASGKQTWLIITKDKEFNGYGSDIEHFKSHSKPAKDYQRKEIGYFTIELLTEPQPNSNGTHPPTKPE